MKIFLRSISLSFIITLVVACSVKEERNANIFEGIQSIAPLSQTLSEYFEVVDSCVLMYPLDLFPQAIGDISITEESIFVFGIAMNPVYPLVEFTRTGQYKRTIGRVGNGPGEIPFQLSRISAYKQKLAIASLGLQRITLFEDGQYIREKSFDFERDSVQIKDILIYDEEYIFVFCNSLSKYNLIILNHNLDILQKIFALPPSTSLTGLIGYTIWGMQKNGTIVVSHTAYPDIIIEVGKINNKFEILNHFEELGLAEYQLLPTDVTATTVLKEGLNPMELFQSFSQFNWVWAQDQYYVGVYGYWGNYISKKVGPPTKEQHYQLFIMRNTGDVIAELPLTYKTVRSVIPDNEKLVEYFFYQKDGEIYLQLNTVKLTL
jgi:hypothetical protein